MMSSSFSATRNILPGSVNNPAMATLINSRNECEIDTQVCTWNKLGYIPVVSTVTGLARALLGVIHSIVHLVSAIFDAKNRDHHLQEAKLGGYNIGRGVIEMIPIIGNIVCFVKDGIIAYKHHNLASEYKNKHRSECEDYAVLCIDGINVGKKSFDQLNQIIDQLNQIILDEKITKRPSFWEEVNLIQRKV